MLNTVLLILAGLVLLLILGVELELLAMRRHPYLARVLAAIVVCVAAYTHNWLALVILVLAALIFLIVRETGRERPIRVNNAAGYLDVSMALASFAISLRRLVRRIVPRHTKLLRCLAFPSLEV